MACKHHQWDPNDVQIFLKTLDSIWQQHAEGLEWESSVPAFTLGWDLPGSETLHTQTNSVCRTESTFSLTLNRCYLKFTSDQVANKASDDCSVVTKMLEAQVTIIHLNYSQRWKQWPCQSRPQSMQRAWTASGTNGVGTLKNTAHCWEPDSEINDVTLDGWGLW